MLEPIDRKTNFPQTQISQPDANKFSALPSLNSIRFGSKNYSQFFTMVSDLFWKMLGWIKYTLFFCFFDADEEKKTELAEELNDFINEYFDYTPSDENGVKAKAKFEELTEEIRLEIKKEIGKILKAACPEFSKEDLDTYTQHFIDNPFDKIAGGETKKPMQGKENLGTEEIYVMGEAICRVKNGYISNPEE